MQKRCPKCKLTKDTSEFSRSSYQAGGFAAYCKKCSYKRHNAWRKKNLPHMRKKMKAWREANPDRYRDHMLKKNYGIPIGTYAEMLKQQEGKCAICKTDTPNGPGRFHVDHDHTTGRIRGLLCHGCNVGIGNLKHDPALLRSAIDYISRKSD